MSTKGLVLELEVTSHVKFNPSDVAKVGATMPIRYNFSSRWLMSVVYRKKMLKLVGLLLLGI
jgi:hypothetical protein